MMRPSLFAAQERGAKRNKLGDTLQVLDRHVDFGALAAEVDRAAPRPDRWHGGRPPFPTEIMVRILLLQQLFNLSDEQMGVSTAGLDELFAFHALSQHQPDSGPHDDLNVSRKD